MIATPALQLAPAATRPSQSHTPSPDPESIRDQRLAECRDYADALQAAADALIETGDLQAALAADNRATRARQKLGLVEDCLPAAWFGQHPELTARELLAEECHRCGTWLRVGGFATYLLTGYCPACSITASYPEA